MAAHAPHARTSYRCHIARRTDRGCFAIGNLIAGRDAAHSRQLGQKFTDGMGGRSRLEQAGVQYGSHQTALML